VQGAGKDSDGGGRLGRYVLYEQLGAGGMAQVFRGVLPMMGECFGKSFAIKKILPCFSEDASFGHLLLDEARLTLRLQHPNVAQTYEIGHHDDNLYIVMELVDGPTLAEVLRGLKAAERLMPVEIALFIAMQAAAGLFAAHSLCDEQGKPLHVIHRDISPQNIMVDRQGVVKIIDFGVAKAEDRLVRTVDGAVRGKLNYFSPERAEGEDFDHRADLFALGLVLWIMLTGTHPLQELGQVESLLAMQQWQAPSLQEARADAPAALAGLLARLLDPDPARRPENGEVLRQELAAVLYGAKPTFSPLALVDFLDALFEGRPGPSPRAEVSPVPNSGADPVIDERPTLIEFSAVDAAAFGIGGHLPVTDRPTLLHLPLPVAEGKTAGEAVRPALAAVRHDPLPHPMRFSTRGIPSSRAAFFVMMGLMLLSALFGGLAVKLWRRPLPEVVQELPEVWPEEDATAVRALVEVEVTSRPSPAAIIINDEALGLSTPAILSLEAGPVRISLRREGFVSKTVQTELIAGRRKVMHLEMERAAVSVRLRLEPAVTAVVEVPSQKRRYLVLDGSGVVVDGIVLDEAVEVVVRRSNGAEVRRQIVAHKDMDEVVVETGW